MGYTGPFVELDCCPYCAEKRYEPEIPGGRGRNIPRKQFHTFPIGPQFQALWHTPEGADNMEYRGRCTSSVLEELHKNNGQRTSPYTDFFDGLDYLTAV